ncbi:MAG: class I SAM-dependent methyltransferase [Halioglobus sp.]
MKPVECSDILSELERWYTSERGDYLLQTTQQAVQSTLDTNFGYHLLQLGLHGNAPLMSGSRISNKLYCAESESAAEGAQLVAHADELPLASDSVDTVIVHHALEFAQNPHRVLREIQRVLTPQGQLLIAVFNPFSAFGAQARLRGLFRDRLWQNYRPIGQGRLTDWLHLLNCEVHGVYHVGGVLPFGRGRLRQWLIGADGWLSDHKVPVGGVLVVHASKQVVGMHPTARRRAQMAPGRLVGLVTKPRPSPVPVPASPMGQNLNRDDKGSTRH